MRHGPASLVHSLLNHVQGWGRELQVKKLREETLKILVASELLAPWGPDDMNLSVPGATQYLQSLAHLAISVCVESPQLWDCPESDGFRRDLLERLLRCPHYEVRLFALEQFLRRLQKTEEECQRRGQGPLPFDLSVSSLTSLALHETYPACQAKTTVRYLACHGKGKERRWGSEEKKNKSSVNSLALLRGNPRARAEPDVFYVQGDGGIDGWMGREECY
ncbi:hypothetical protein H4Q32_008954 [Labeo rohita]|uniref:Uncharacterized protein n=1 Tax=Labeo rohita TaxID=84645 RepID=A0ABQ8M4M9_LABRO|nr:hypothetical protein H4Q32_008954 [Labeo rohita]